MAVTLPLELVLGARVYRRPQRWLAAVLPVLLMFGAWDWAEARAGAWGYNRRYILGPRLGGVLPLEEVLFFVVVPTCALLTYEAVGELLDRLGRARQPARPPGQSGPRGT